MKTTTTTILLLITTALFAQKFTEVSESAGINHAFQIDLATFGGGACVLDFDNDGWEDLYVTGGVQEDALYQNNGDGTFTDVHAAAGFDRTLETYTQGVAAADINRDGFKDLLITSMNFIDENRTNAPNLLYLNNGDGTFRDVTKEWGLEDFRTNSMAATFGDVNMDGFPDLFIANYFSNSSAGISIYNEQTITNSFRPAEDYFFINASGQTFVDARKLYGLDYDGFGFQGMFTDFDNDRDLDLYVANDFGFKSTPNLFFRNDFPAKRLKDRANSLLLNYGMNAMGLARADYNFDGWMDYMVVNLGISVFTVNEGNGKGFDESTFDVNLGITTIRDSIYTGPPVSWGANFFDFDNDRDLDLFIANGALNPTIRPNPNFFFVYDHKRGFFNEESADLGLRDYRIGRGSVVFDYDNDGDMDLFVVNQIPRDLVSGLDEPRCLLHRNEAADGNWLKVELEGVTQDKNGIGARVEVEVDGQLLIREIDGGSSHLSQNSTIAHFGLGESTKVDRVTVKWLGGKTQTLENVATNQQLNIKEATSKQENEKSATNLTVFPNSFHNEVWLTYNLEQSEAVELHVYDAQGRWIQQLTKTEGEVASGIWQWQVPSYLPKGAYVFQLRTPTGTIGQRAVRL
ncbi:MAG: FG-GAP-like repeat-containing protein [Bacteroidota bacterium]